MINIQNYKKFLYFIIKNVYVKGANINVCFNNKFSKKLFKYMKQIQMIINNQKDVFEFFLEDLFNFSPSIYIKLVISNTKRFCSILKEVIDDIISEKIPLVTSQNVIYHQKYILTDKKLSAKFSIVDINKYRLPVYQIIIIPLLFQKPVPFFLLGGSFIGKFILVSGKIVDIKRVQYLLKKAFYFCKSCGFYIDQHVNLNKFRPLLFCPTEKCKYSNISEHFYFDTNLSLFEKVQEIKIETTFVKDFKLNKSRILKVRLYGHLTETCCIGDMIKIGGVLLPVHLMDGKIGITAENMFLDTLFLEKNSAPFVYKKKKSFIENELFKIFKGSNIFDKISHYLDFYIFGNYDLKKSIILSLVGANFLDSNGNYKSNNTINIFIFSEIQTINSNLLEIISQIAPIGVYNDALFLAKKTFLKEKLLFKKNKNTSEKIYIANNGITCIDNIECLEEEDFLDIFESIYTEKTDYTKIKKKSTIIASSYQYKNVIKLDKTQSIQSILFNFDLAFPFSNLSKRDFDYKMANNILEGFKINPQSTTEIRLIRSIIIKTLIFEAQKGFPYILDEVASFLIYWYNNTKARYKEEEKYDLNVLNLDRILRISKCLARIKFQNKVCFYDIKEAFRLLETKNKYAHKKTCLVDKNSKVMENRVFKIIKNTFKELNSNIVDIKLIEKKVLYEGYNCDDLIKCLGFYEELNEFVIDINLGKIKISE